MWDSRMRWAPRTRDLTWRDPHARWLAALRQALSSACSARHILMALLDAQPENWAMECDPPTNPVAPFLE